LADCILPESPLRLTQPKLRNGKQKAEMPFTRRADAPPKCLFVHSERLNLARTKPSAQVMTRGRIRPDRAAKLGTPHTVLSWRDHGLQPFGVNSRVMRIGTQRAKGYDLVDFTEAFARFL